MNKTKNNREQSIFISMNIHKYLLVSVISLVIFFGLAQGVAGATLYCGSSATGSGSGADWNNQCAFNSQTLTRGNTYYIATGSYSRYSFDTAVSGSLYIYIKKATESDHGTDIGWQTSYGIGQAVFDSSQVSSSDGGYLEIDGQYEYGIKFLCHDEQMGYGFRILNGAPNVHLRYVEIAGPGGATNYYYNYNIFGFYSGNASKVIEGFIMSYCSSHGTVDPVHWSRGNNALFEYNDFYDSRSSSPQHTNVFYLSGNAQNITIRYNRFHNYTVEGIFVTGYDGTNIGNIYIYGNIFYDGETVARGLELRQEYSYGAFYFYNNTCINLPLSCVRNVADGTSGGAIRNNIGYNTGFSFGSIPNSNNLTSSSDIFVNSASDDYHLKSPTSSGTILSTPYNVDADGKTRGADGVWDLGAYEYVSGPPDATKPSAITNLSISNPTANSITLSWTSPGDDGNTGRASSYDIRYFTSNITESNWSSATPASGEPSPLTAGISQSMTVSGLLSNTTYYFAIKTFDEASNVSDLSNVPSAATAEAPSGLGLIEAESGAITLPMQKVLDSDASGGEYVQTLTEDSGTATYTLNIPETGIYKIVARVYAANAGTDSFFFQIDNQAEDTWDFNPSVNPDEFNAWREDEVTKRGNGTPTNPQYDPYTLQLTQGSHTITFRGREANAKLDYFRFAQITDTIPPAAPQGLTVS